jgi:hypothetical protein
MAKLELQGWFGGGGTGDGSGFIGGVPIVPTPTPTCTSTTTCSQTPTQTYTQTPSISLTPSNTPTISLTPSITPTISLTTTRTATPSVTPQTPTPTPSKTARKIPSTPTPRPTRFIDSFENIKEPIDSPVIFITQTPTPTPTPTQTQTPTQTSTQTRTPSQTPTQTPSTTKTASPTPTKTPTSSQTGSPTSSQTPTGSPTGTPTQTRTGTGTGTPTRTGTPTQTPTQTGTGTPAPTPTQTPTSTATPSTTKSATPSSTPTQTQTGTITSTPSRTPPETPTPTGTTTPSATVTPSKSPTASGTPTQTPTGTTEPGAGYSNISWWRLQNDLLDSSPGSSKAPACDGYNLFPRPNIAVDYRAARYGNGLYWDESNLTARAFRNLADYPNCPRISIALWVNVTLSPDVVADSYFFQSQIPGRSGQIYEFGYDSSGYPFINLFRNSSSGGSRRINGRDVGCPIITDNTWKRLIFQVDATNPTAVKYTLLVDTLNGGVQLKNSTPVDCTSSNTVPDGKQSNIYVVNGSPFTGMVDEVMVWDRNVSINELFRVLNTPTLLEQCTTQTPTPTQSRTASQTPSQTRTPAPSVLPEIRPGVDTPPKTCLPANRNTGCPGSTLQIIIAKYGVFSGTNATNGQLYVIPLTNYSATGDITTLAGVTLLGGVNSPTSSYIAGTGTFSIKTSNFYVFQMKNNLGQLSNQIFEYMDPYRWP